MKNKIFITMLSGVTATILFTGCDDDAKSIAKAHVESCVSGNKAEVLNLLEDGKAAYFGKVYAQCENKKDGIAFNSAEGKKILKEEDAKVQNIFKKIQNEHTVEELKSMTYAQQKELFEKEFINTIIYDHIDVVLSGRKISQREERQFAQEFLAKYTKKNKDKYGDIEKICTFNIFSMPTIKDIKVISNRKIADDKSSVKIEAIKNDGGSIKINVDVEKFNGVWKVVKSELLDNATFYSLRSSIYGN